MRYQTFITLRARLDVSVARVLKQRNGRLRLFEHLLKNAGTGVAIFVSVIGLEAGLRSDWQEGDARLLSTQ